MKYKLTKEQIEFIENESQAANIGEDTYFHIPFWYKFGKDGKVEKMQFHELPENLQSFILTLQKGELPPGTITYTQQ